MGDREPHIGPTCLTDISALPEPMAHEIASFIELAIRHAAQKRNLVPVSKARNAPARPDTRRAVPIKSRVPIFIQLHHGRIRISGVLTKVSQHIDDMGLCL